jgi:uncharacterized protein YndB with AHSA1/START domain
MVVALIASAAAARDSGARRDALASQGQIDDNAPVKASTEIVVAAPIDKVWKVLSDIDGWPKWQPAISSAESAGPLKAGTEFTWRTGATRIKSRLALVAPNTDLSWTGKAFGAKAIHVWHLKAVDGGTLVSTRESLTGFMLRMFYSSKKLANSQKEWLQALKRAAEK